MKVLPVQYYLDYVFYPCLLEFGMILCCKKRTEKCTEGSERASYVGHSLRIVFNNKIESFNYHHGTV